MKKQKLNIKVRDLEPLKNVTGGRRRHHRHHGLHAMEARAINPRVGEERDGLGLLGLR